MKRLYRSTKDKKIAGICSGLGHYFEIDPTIIRLIVILLAIVTAIIPFLIVYFIAIFIIPIDPEEKAYLKGKRLFRSHDKIIAGICSGFGKYFYFDKTIIRLFLIVITIITGIVPMVLLYLIAWAIIPIEPESIDN